MRLIDADELKRCFKTTTFRGNRFCEVFDSYVDAAPTIEPQKWIPCSDRLPEKGKDVLVTRHYDGSADGNKSCGYVEIAGLGGCDDEVAWYSYSDEYKMHPRNHRVIAWMPLPEPYGGEQE